MLKDDRTFHAGVDMKITRIYYRYYYGAWRFVSALRKELV